ncbi:TetR family transcriptional regulator [Salinisphaera sp. PC39]
MDAALALVAAGHSLGALSLRQLTREVGIVPTAFYRHFPDMETLGLALVAESMHSLRQLLRAARREDLSGSDVIRRSVEILVRHVHANRLHFGFIARERHGGNAAVRGAIRQELRLFESELATDLARFPILERWSTEDLQMLAGLLVNAMVSTAESILDAPARDSREEAAIVATTEKQLRLIMLGVPHWRSDASDRKGKDTRAEGA